MLIKVTDIWHSVVVLDQPCYSTTQIGHSQMTSWFRETQQKPDLIASRASESVGERSQPKWKISVYIKKRLGRKLAKGEVDGIELNTSRENESRRGEEDLHSCDSHLLSHSSKHLKVKQTICPEQVRLLTVIIHNGLLLMSSCLSV